MPDCQNCKLRKECGTKIVLGLMASLHKEAGIVNHCRDFEPEKKEVLKNTMESSSSAYRLLQLGHRWLNVWMLDDGCYAVAYQGADVKDGIGLLGVFGKGQSFESACTDYLRRIRGKTLVFDADSESRKEVFVM